MAFAPPRDCVDRPGCGEAGFCLYGCMDGDCAACKAFSTCAKPECPGRERVDFSNVAGDGPPSRSALSQGRAPVASLAPIPIASVGGACLPALAQARLCGGRSGFPLELGAPQGAEGAEACRNDDRCDCAGRGRIPQDRPDSRTRPHAPPRRASSAASVIAALMDVSSLTCRAAATRRPVFSVEPALTRGGNVLNDNIGALLSERRVIA